MEVEYLAIFPPVLALIGLHCKMLGKIQTLSGKLLLLQSQRLIQTRSKIGIWYLVSACEEVGSPDVVGLCDSSKYNVLVWHEQSSQYRFGHYNVYDSKNLQQLHKAPQLFKAHGLINMLSCCLSSWRTRICSWPELYIIEESGTCSGRSLLSAVCRRHVRCFRFLDSLNEISALTTISMKIISEKPVCCK